MWVWVQVIYETEHSRRRDLFFLYLVFFFNKNVTEFIIWYKTDDKVDLDLNRDHHIQTSIDIFIFVYQ